MMALNPTLPVLIVLDDFLNQVVLSTSWKKTLVLDRKPFSSVVSIFRRFLSLCILKGLSHEIDFKNFDKNLQNLT
jgi:hypothetical protein